MKAYLIYSLLGAPILGTGPMPEKVCYERGIAFLNLIQEAIETNKRFVHLKSDDFSFICQTEFPSIAPVPPPRPNT